LDWEFQFAQFEVGASELPTAVTDAIAADYSDFQIEDDRVERQEWADGTIRFSFELESDEDDVEVIFNADGTLYCIDD